MSRWRLQAAHLDVLAVEGGSHPYGHLGPRVDEVVLPAITVLDPYSVFVGLGRAGSYHFALFTL